MENSIFGLRGFDPRALPSPCFVVDEQLLAHNLSVLRGIEEASGARILLAQKGFAMHALYPQISASLSGVCASGLYEARLGREKFNKEVHSYSPAFDPREIKSIIDLSDHVVFNSFPQWLQFRELCAQKPELSCGIRINPQVSTAQQAIYDPCAPGSRLGVRKEAFREDLLEGIEGLHFHALCEQDLDALQKVLEAFDRGFGCWASQMKWLNFGGGHHITREGYDRTGLIALLKEYRDRYQVQIYLEPGEAVALNCGILVAQVLDIVENGGRIAILNTSASCHMPDVLEMPYRPEVYRGGMPGEKPYTYELAGCSCLAGDRIGSYSFDQGLEIGDYLYFSDMAHYSMVKTNTFNGIALPSIAIHNSNTASSRLVKRFDYQEFYRRLS